MLKNYFKIAWRNLLKRKFYTLVTIFGLSVGMTFTFLMMSYVSGELNVNRDLRNADNQVIIRSKWKNPDMGVDLATLGPLGKTLKEDYPNLVANYYRYDGITVAVSKGDKHFREDVQTGDSTLLTMYGFPLLHGDARTAMNAPNTIAITENKAIKYFGKTDVIPLYGYFSGIA
jgi:putative ABC transport system permease protein